MNVEELMASLWPLWEELYDTTLAKDPYFEEVVFEHLCVGWCLAKGLSVANAQKFYQSCVGKGKF